MPIQMIVLQKLSIVILVVMLYCKLFLFFVLETCYYSAPIIRTANLMKLITTLFIHTVIIINANIIIDEQDTIKLFVKHVVRALNSLIGCH